MKMLLGQLPPVALTGARGGVKALITKRKGMCVQEIQ